MYGWMPCTIKQQTSEIDVDCVFFIYGEILTDRLAIFNSEVGNAIASESDANLEITKADDPDPVIAGNDLTYAITVTNLTSSQQ